MCKDFKRAFLSFKDGVFLGRHPYVKVNKIPSSKFSCYVTLELQRAVEELSERSLLEQKKIFFSKLFL